jgi:type IV pilus assembly protein PilQ
MVIVPSPARRAALSLLGAALGLVATGLQAAQLENIEVSTLPGDRVQLRLKLDGPAPDPVAFAIDNPARVAVDLTGTTIALRERRRDVGVGAVRSVAAAEAQGRTRVVVNLAEMVGYEARAEGDSVIIVLGTGGGAAVASAQAASVATPRSSAAARDRRLQSIDFRRGDLGEGRIIVKLGDPSTAVNVREEGGKVILDFPNASLPPELLQRFDVLDFATPVKTIDAMREGVGARLVVGINGKFEQLAYQSDDTFTLEIKAPAVDETIGTREKVYEGERLTLNFQDIETRAILQIIADFTGMNVVVSDSVRGNVTLRLQNVPWDQALDIILRSKGLAMRQNGNVLLIAPANEIAEREKIELESAKKTEELVALRSEFIQVNYAKASQLAGLLKTATNSMLSSRGSVTIDERTNTLLVMDTDERLADIRKLVRKLDIPIRQVLIESRIVIAGDDFTRELGARLGVSGFNLSGNNLISYGGSQNASNEINNSVVDFLNGNSDGITFPADRLAVNLPANAPTGSFGFTISGSDYMVDLELSAAQAEGRSELVSSPRLITSNQKEAIIKQGVQIPYQQASASGATSTQFKDAVLELKVTPQITPDDRVIMDLSVKKDSVGQQVPSATGGFVPSIDTREITTQVLVNNGDTVVLGGIYETEKINSVSKVPLLGDIPVVGILFRNTIRVDDKGELLIFITPKIIKEGLALN